MVFEIAPQNDEPSCQSGATDGEDRSLQQIEPRVAAVPLQQGSRHDESDQMSREQERQADLPQPVSCKQDLCLPDFGRDDFRLLSEQQVADSCSYRQQSQCNIRKNGKEKIKLHRLPPAEPAGVVCCIALWRKNALSANDSFAVRYGPADAPASHWKQGCLRKEVSALS